MPTTYTLRPTPGLKGCYDVLCNGQIVAQGFGRDDMKREYKAYQAGRKQVRYVEPEAAVAAKAE